MKKTASVCLMFLALATVNGQFSSPTPPPKPSPTVLEASIAPHPYSLLEYRYADGTVRIEARNDDKCYQSFYVTYTDLVNVDRSSNMARMLLPLNNKAEQGVQPGEARWVGGLMPADPGQALSYKYRLTTKPYCPQAQSFDVHLDEKGKQSHPKPPESEWSKLRTLADAMSAGDAKPFEWVLDARRHPTQILRVGDESAAEAKIYGDKTPEEFGAELNELIKNGMNPAQAALKLQEQALKDFRAGMDRNTKIVYRASDGTLQERPATATELEALRKKYAKYMKSQSP